MQGRKVTGSPPVTPLGNRQGIPKQELGECVRCNLQIEGSGPKPVDVIMDGGSDYNGNPDKEPSAKPKGWAKHVVLRVDRGDGFHGGAWNKQVEGRGFGSDVELEGSYGSELHPRQGGHKSVVEEGLRECGLWPHLQLVLSQVIKLSARLGVVRHERL